ncbi:MAG: ABC transporter ATP-binding protein [Nostocales cyanobacterium]|nr:MAG: ABC transporter ATP-binding protein [Nostocales cyanobacterium]TAF18935.1 MAG: ABC transporter ATP-binding protein [Nostocales cyanobacterium]
MSIYLKNKKPSENNRRNNNDWRLFLRLLPYGRRNNKLLTWSMLLLIPIGIANSVQPLLIGQAVSLIRQEPGVYEFIKNRPITEGLNILQGLFLLTIIVKLSLTGYQGFLVQKLGQKITSNIRQDLFIHVTSLAINFFERTPVGKLITRLINDVESLGDVFATGAVSIFADIFSMLLIIGFMFSIQWQLAGILIFILIPVAWLIIYFQKEFRKATYKSREELSKLNSQLQENIVGIDVVQLFRRENFNSELFRNSNQKYVKEVDITIWYDSAVSATLEWVGLIAIAGVLWIGGVLLLENNLTFGILSAFVLYAQKLFVPLQNFAEKFTTIQSGLTAIERVNNLLEEPIEIKDMANPRFSILDNQFGYIDEIINDLETQNFNTPIELGEIKFENVWFAYKDDDYVLRNLDFTIHPGEKIALVGPTGAGKSSVIRLLCRLYEPTQGRILIDGIDIREIPQAELRRYMAVILQEAFLFAGDVKSNIALGDSYSFEEIEQAAIKTNVADFIQQLPQGYDTELRARGTNISSGQKQLLAFARAAIRNPQILVLDEATANLDVSTEALVQQALNQLLTRRTAIIIAHRLSTIRNVGRIFVLKRGELIEQGSHDQLIAQGGFYSTLHNLQMLGI